ncbi:helix-turn-helix transcriptional regulator [uncultured Sphingomonas sp.]|uniref:helix-turn-helix domain-containing protein n=1 Tax=uncultured Sphingomonas sp. TaxID=158754 RepID=UPI002590E33A|nr:helix-turn-helix transcriptional regulator [uncultured Sphingomonas sp.]
MMKVEQCRAARALLDWSAQQLADQAGIGVATVRRFESGSVVAASSVEAMMSSLGAAGIAFITAGEVSRSGGDGVRLTSTSRD